MADKYSVINLRSFLDKQSPAYIEEQKLYRLLAVFSSPQNEDVEHFLHTNAIEFTKKNQSVSYLVFDNDTTELVGYFAIAIKPLIIQAETISKTAAKKLSRISILDEATNTFTASAYLLAQFGKNYAISKENRITGEDLLALALSIIENTRYAVGGVLEFLECDDNQFLLDFYTSHGFRQFDTRTVISENKESHILHQLLKFI